MVNPVIESIDPRGVVTLTLNRPDVHNAFDDALIADLSRMLDRLNGDRTVRAIVLTSIGRSFSAGADLEWMRRAASQSYEENRADAARLAKLLHTLDRLSKPTLAIVQGAAYGGGVGLVACCDIAIASDTATFCLSEVKLGLTPATICPYVINAIGPRWARRLFQTAEAISAAAAREIGLVHEVVLPAELAQRQEAVLSALLRGAPGAQSDSKELVFLCEGRWIDDALRVETGRRIAARRASEEGREGIAAFLGKRKPAWYGAD